MSEAHSQLFTFARARWAGIGLGLGTMYFIHVPAELSWISVGWLTPINHYTNLTVVNPSKKNTLSLLMWAFTLEEQSIETASNGTIQVLKYAAVKGRSAKVRSTCKAYTTVVWRLSDGDRDEFRSQGYSWRLYGVSDSILSTFSS